MIFSASLFSLICVVALKLIRGGNSLSLSSRPFTFCLRWSLVFLLSPRPSLFLFVYIKRSALFISNPLKYPNGESQRPTKRYRQKHPMDTGSDRGARVVTVSTDVFECQRDTLKNPKIFGLSCDFIPIIFHFKKLPEKSRILFYNRAEVYQEGVSGCGVRMQNAKLAWQKHRN